MSTLLFQFNKLTAVHNIEITREFTWFIVTNEGLISAEEQNRFTNEYEITETEEEKSKDHQDYQVKDEEGFIFSIKQATMKKSVQKIKEIIVEELNPTNYSEVVNQSLIKSLDQFDFQSDPVEDENKRKEEIIHCLFPCPLEILQNREKHQRIGYREKLHVFKYYGYDRMPLSAIQRLTRLRRQTIRKIIKNFEGNPGAQRLVFSKYGNNLLNSDLVGQSIEEYLESEKRPVCRKDIATHLKRNLNICISSNKIGTYLKKKGYSYKKASSRPTDLDVERQQLWGYLFSIKVSKLLLWDTILVNI